MPAKPNSQEPSPRPRIEPASNRAFKLSNRDREAIRLFASSETFFYLEQEAQRHRLHSPGVVNDLPHKASHEAGYLVGFKHAFDVIISIARETPGEPRQSEEITYER